MGDDATINEILNDVDTDFVRKIVTKKLYPPFYTVKVLKVLMEDKFYLVGWEDQL